MAEMLSYVERDSVIHRLSGATKLIGFLLWSLAIMLTYDTRLLLLFLTASLVLFYVSKVKWEDVRFVVIVILAFLLLNNLLIYLFSPEQGVDVYGTRHVIFEFVGRYTLTQEQLFYMFNVTLKYVTVIPVALLFLVTTHPSEFASSLNRIGVNYKIAYAVSIALRYIPDIQRDFKQILVAQQARGIDLSSQAKFTTRARHILRLLIPLILSSLSRIDTVSQAMDLRRFGKHPQKTWFRSRPFTWHDWVAIVVCAVALCTSLTMTMLNGDRFYNPFL